MSENMSDDSSDDSSLHIIYATQLPRIRPSIATRGVRRTKKFLSSLCDKTREASSKWSRYRRRRRNRRARYASFERRGLARRTENGFEVRGPNGTWVPAHRGRREPNNEQHRSSTPRAQPPRGRRGSNGEERQSNARRSPPRCQRGTQDVQTQLLLHLFSASLLYIYHILRTTNETHEVNVPDELLRTWSYYVFVSHFEQYGTLIIPPVY